MRKRRLHREEAEYLGEQFRHLRLFLEGLRRECGLTQEAVGLRGEMDRKVLGRIERGEVDPSFGTLVLLAKGLGLPPQGFFRAFADYLRGEGVQCEAWREGRYYTRDGSEWIEIWRGSERSDPRKGRQERP